MHARSLRSLHTARVRHWLRLLLLCSVFSAVHMPLGAWVVSSISAEPVVQICTPQGLQWVGVTPGDEEDGTGLHAAALQPCVWSAAHVAISPPPWFGSDVASPGCAAAPCHGLGVSAPDDLIWRVLLMSAMRAPPGLSGSA
jgi:hypothetical protein